MTTTTMKAFRTEAAVAAAIKQLAAIAGRDEGDLLGDMLDAYLVLRSPELAERFPSAEKLLTAKPDKADAVLVQLRVELAQTLEPQRVGKLLGARERLLKAREERQPATAAHR